MTSKHSNITSKIGLKIKLLRNKQGLSQEDLASKSELSATSLGTIERGTSVPGIDTLERIANALGIELKELVDVSKIDLD
ncbi:MAG: helix-turn-helix domain-containing protein [Fusobacterium sp.]|nr:helix-turn-helix domain-containing protein [Fusobacterium sp.]